MTEWEFKDIIRPLAGDPNADGFDDRLQGYHDRCRGTLTQLLQYIPLPVRRVADVGCGMGGIGLLIAGDNPAWKARIALVDGTDSVRNIAGHRPIGYQPFSEHNQPWNDATLVADRFRQHGFDAQAYDPTSPDWGPCDVIVSTRSWGHHYPVAVYLDRAFACLQPGGIVALEIRTKTDGIETMQKHFRLVDVTPAVHSTKCQMAVFTRT